MQSPEELKAHPSYKTQKIFFHSCHSLVFVPTNCGLMKLNERPIQERTYPHLDNLPRLRQVTQAIWSIPYPEACKNEEGYALLASKARTVNHFEESLRSQLNQVGLLRSGGLAARPACRPQRTAL